MTDRDKAVWTTGYICVSTVICLEIRETLDLPDVIHADICLVHPGPEPHMVASCSPEMECLAPS